MGYGRSELRDGSVFQWNFPLLGTYWSAADIIMQHIALKEGGFDKLKGKKIVLVYHDSPYGKEPIALLEQRAKMHGFEFTPMPVTHPGVEQKSTWLQIRQNRPGLRPAVGLGRYELDVDQGGRRRRLPARQAVRRVVVGRRARRAAGRRRRQGLPAPSCCSMAPASSPSMPSSRSTSTTRARARRSGTRPARSSTTAAWSTPCWASRRSARRMTKYGNKPLTGEQVRWGIENLDLTAARLKETRLRGHAAAAQGHLQRPRGRARRPHPAVGRRQVGVVSDWYQSRRQGGSSRWSTRRPRYADEKKLPVRARSRELSDEAGVRTTTP